MYGTGGLFVRCGSALVLVLMLILVLVLILVHDGHLLLYLRYRDSVTGIGENMHGSA